MCLFVCFRSRGQSSCPVLWSLWLVCVGCQVCCWSTSAHSPSLQLSHWSACLCSLQLETEPGLTGDCQHCETSVCHLCVRLSVFTCPSATCRYFYLSLFSALIKWLYRWTATCLTDKQTTVCLSLSVCLQVYFAHRSFCSVLESDITSCSCLQQEERTDNHQSPDLQNVSCK